MGVLLVHSTTLLQSAQSARVPSPRPFWAYNLRQAAGGAGMAKTKQFMISVDNHPGAVAEIAKTLGGAKVNILSLLGTVQGTGGTVQLLVDDARRAKKALDSARISYQETPAELLELPNKPGTLAQCLDKLAAKGVNLSSIHATAAKGGKKAVIVYTAEAAAKVATATA
ncbi:MAG TPA: hypothetical protein VMR90_06760 [Candidatus Cybelea sp.]|nr:hypothetical protein [Candidatus Cybelea sp.]